MELNISEFSDNSMSSYDQIPENNAPIKVIKQQQQQKEHQFQEHQRQFQEHQHQLQLLLQQLQLFKPRHQL